MDYFPLFIKLAGQSVIVIGGGEVAARKVNLLLKTNAQLTVISPYLNKELTAAVDRGALQHRATVFHPEQLAGARLVIAATDEPAINAQVAAAAEARGILVNVVDQLELSRCIMPAIIDRSPVIVAVASSGTAPVLTRRLREQLEALLPAALGKLAKLSGQWRKSVQQRVSSADARRRFWERFFDGEIAADVLAGREQAAHTALATALAQAERAQLQQPASGEVALVGAGPGDPGLLTLRALRVLQNADVVVYDRLVSTAVLELARRDAERIYVGKTAGKVHVEQAAINQLLVRLAQQGKRVCRLKGGDPFIFGRGGEELEVLAAHGIRFEVVPGITAALGCAAYAGIPLTHRDHAQCVSFATGHTQENIPMAPVAEGQVALPGQTMVFYMALTALPNLLQRLLAQGVPGERPAAVIEQGTYSTQRVITGTVATLVAQVAQAAVRSPALLIIGEVTRLHERLRWFNTTAAQAHADEIESVAAHQRAQSRAAADVEFC